MLRERVFEIGGVLCILAGLLVITAYLLNRVPVVAGLLPEGGLLIGFGAFFIYVGRSARRSRQRALQALEQSP